MTIIDAIKVATALDSTYGRGLALTLSGAVDVFDVVYDYESDKVSLAAYVDGSSGDEYLASVVLDLGEARVESHYCSCPAHAKYDGMCKHAVATALCYLNSIGMAGIGSASSGRSSLSAPTPASAQVKHEPATSYAIEDLMSRYAEQVADQSQRLAREAREYREEPAEPVDIICTIALGEGSYSNRFYDGETWKLGLKVVRGKTSYVAKHVDEVVRAWRERLLYSYGKNLTFVHRREAFTDHANAILDMLSPIVDAQWALHTARENRYYSQPSLATKTLALSTSQVGRIFDLNIGATVDIEWSSAARGRRRQSGGKSTVPVVDETPTLNVVIAPAETGGYDLSIPNGAVECLYTNGRVYLVARDAVFRCSREFSADMGPFCVSLLPARGVQYVSAADMPQFCASVLPALRKYTHLAAPEGLVDLMPPVAEFEFRIGEENGYITCQSIVRYGDDWLDLFEPAREGQPVRHVAREIAAQRLVGQYFPNGDQRTPEYAFPDRPGQPRIRTAGWGDKSRVRASANADEPPFPWFDEGDDAAYYLLFTDGLRELSNAGDVLLSERLRNVEVRQAPGVRVDASVRSGLLDIEAHSPDMKPAELMAYLSSYRRRQRFVRLKNGDIVLLDGGVGALADLADGLGIEPADLVEGVHDLPANRTLFVDAMLKRAGGVRFNRDEGFRKIVRDFETVADADFTAPHPVGDVLRPYQVEGFKWLCTLGKVGFGGILADDMGLGKTLQMIAYLLHERDGGEELPALVVCPASLAYNWMAEIERFAPSLNAVAVVGTKRKRAQVIARAADYDVLVTSYDLMKRDIDDYAAVSFSCAVLDEAQYIKNSTTKAAKCAKRLQARVRFALTGTPIENRLNELWSIFDFLMPGVLGSSDSFANRFTGPIASKQEAAAKRLQSLVGPFILRRLKGDVLQDLPEKTESIVYANMEGEQAKLYRATSDRLMLTLNKQMPEEFKRVKFELLAELTKLRQICCDPHLLYENYIDGSAKLETCLELVRNAVEGGHALLLFSQFTSMLGIIADRLRAEKIGYFTLTGATPKEERARLVERFQAGEVPVFLISLKAGGVGLNLTAADIVIHYDPWWNMAAQNQATDRVHRIGQTQRVSVFKLIAKGTIEERIVQMQESKRDLAESVLGGEVVSASSITREDLLALLGAQ